MPICARRLSWVSPAMSRPSIRMRPCSGRRSRSSRLHQGRLAGAGAADQADPLARRDVEVEPAQHPAAPRAAAIVEMHVLEPHRAHRALASRPRRARPASAAAPRSSACRPAPGRYCRRYWRSAAPPSRRCCRSARPSGSPSPRCRSGCGRAPTSAIASPPVPVSSAAFITISETPHARGHAAAGGDRRAVCSSTASRTKFVLVAGAGEKLDGQDVGVAVDDPAGDLGAHLRHAARALAHARQEHPQHRGIGREPADDRQRQPPVGGGEEQRGARAVDQDVPDRVDAGDDALAQRRAGLHHPVGDAAGEIVLKIGPALAHDVPMALPARQVGEAGDQRLVGDQRRGEMRDRPQHQQQQRHPEELPAGGLPDGVRRLRGHQRGDAADKDRDRRIEQRDDEPGHEQRAQQTGDLPHEMPIEADKRVRAAELGRRYVRRLLGRLDQAFEETEHWCLHAYGTGSGQQPWRVATAISYFPWPRFDAGTILSLAVAR